MSLALFIKRPVLAAAICVFTLFVGLLGYFLLPVRDYPVLPASRITVTTTYPGASPQVMEGFVSTPIEQALTGLDGLDYMSSANTEGQSLITLKFPIGYNIDKILPRVTNRVNSVLWMMPKAVNSPVVTRVNPNEGPTGAIMYVGFYADDMTMEQVSDYITRVIQTQLESLKGVALVEMWGARNYSMRVWLDPALMAAHNVKASDVYKALLNNNLRSTAGQLKGRYLLFNVNASSSLSSPEQFNRIVVKQDKGTYVRLADIGKVKLGAENRNIVGFINGHNAVAIGIVPQAAANSIEVSGRVHAMLKQFTKQMPPGMHYTVLLDKTKFSKKSIHEVRITLLEACIFVFIVIFMFLGSFRLLSVPIVTIPLSLLGGCALMLALGYSLNSLTFLAAVLAIGLVVDDAIVVIENVHRHIQMGQSKIEAAINGVHEIRNPVISMTLTVAIVLMPIGFISGFSGALFKEFAFCMALVVLMSGVLALFVSPAMCAKVLQDKEPKLSKKIDAVMERLKHHYTFTLRHFVEMRWLVLVLFVAVITAGLHLQSKIPSELIPAEDEGVVVGIGVSPTGMNKDYTQYWGSVFEKIFSTYPYRNTYGVFYGFPSLPTQMNGFVVLKDNIKITEDQALTFLDSQLKKIPGILAFAVKMPTLPGAMQMQNVNFVLKTTRSYQDLNAAMNRLLKAAKNSASVTNAQSNLKMSQVQVNVEINRQKAYALGVPVSEITDALTVTLGEPYVNRFGMAGRSYEVIPQVFHHFRMNPDDINNIYVSALNGELVQLSDVVDIDESMTPNTLNQFQLMRSATLTASVAPGHTLGQALNFLKSYVHTDLGKGFHVDYSGRSRQYIQSMGVLQEAFAVAIVLIYLLLTVNFASFRDPLIVMLSVPLSLVGAVYAMYLSGATFNIYTKIGLIMLVGLISKHGILIVNFANMLQEQKGLSVIEAAIESASIRLRPILMTTIAMIAGAIPLIMASGAGKAARQQIGWVVIGGMALGTCLSLFVVPTAYSAFAKRFSANCTKVST